MHKSLEDEEVDASGTVGKCSISKNHGMEAMDSGIRDTEIMSKQKTAVSQTSINKIIVIEAFQVKS